MKRESKDFLSVGDYLDSYKWLFESEGKKARQKANENFKIFLQNAAKDYTAQKGCNNCKGFIIMYEGKRMLLPRRRQGNKSIKSI